MRAWHLLAVCCIALAQALLPSAARAADPATKATAPTQTPPQLQQKALDILKAASDALAAAKTLTFNAVIEEEGPALGSGLPLEFTSAATVALQRPDKLVVKTHGAGPAQEIFYDGKTLIAWVPQQNAVATMPAPPTIDAMLNNAYDRAAIYLPFTDVIVSDPYKDLVDRLTVAFYVGQSDIVGGTATDMIAFGNAGVFVQAWIGTKDKLPRRLRAIYLDDPAALRHDLVLSNWKLNVRLPAETFVAKVAPGAEKIPFENPAAIGPSGTPPVAGSPKSKGPAKDGQ